MRADIHHKVVRHMEADGGDRCHITHYSWDSQFCGRLLCLDCVISGMFYNNHNFLLHFSVFWYNGHKSSHQSSVSNKILSGWQLDQVTEIHECIRDWLCLHPLSARENFTDFCHCKNFKTYPQVFHCVHLGSPIRKSGQTYHDFKREAPTKANLHKL